MLTCDGDVRYVEGSRPEVASQRAFYAALAEHGTHPFEAMGCWIAQRHRVPRRGRKRGGWSDRRSRDASAETGTRAEHPRMDNGHLAGYEMDSFHATRAERWRTCGVPG